MKRRIKTFLAGGLLALALFGAAMAGPFEDGEAAYQKGDYAAAVSYWRPLADQGNAEAQNDLGSMYQLGHGVPQNDAQAIAWYRKAADQGEAEAQTNLGWMYQLGHGVPQNYTQAIAWYRKAADQGEAEAQFNLGLMYAYGRGAPQDYVKAHIWLKFAASGASDAKIRYIVVKARDALAAKMTPAQIAEAQRLASEWTPK